MSSLSTQYPKLRIEGLRKSFSTGTGTVEVLAGIDLTVASGQFISVIGPSGCGKSTLFNILAGLTPHDSGTIALNGQPVANLRGKVGYMLQRDLLMPWRTVIDNVVIGLEVRGHPRRDALDRAGEYIDMLGLRQFANSYPKELSGGMRQRVALARTLLPDPDILLLDEPFSALDYQTRLFLEDLLIDTVERTGKTVILVTHDIDEAIALSEKIFVLSARPGRVKNVHDISLTTHSPIEARRDPAFTRHFEALCSELDIQTTTFARAS